MSKSKISGSSPLLNVAARAVVGAGARMSLPAAHRMGSALGHLAWLLPNQFRRVTQLNLAWCYPDEPRAVRDRLARASLIETGRTTAEAGAMLTWAPGRLRALVAEIEGGELLDRALASGRGTVLLLPHLGNWEVLNPWLAERRPFVALYRPPRIAELDRLLLAARQRTGCTMAPTTPSGLKMLLTELSRGGLVLILPDQEPVRSSGIFAPFFGVPALTMTLVGRLLRRCGAEALFAWAERTSNGSFRVRLKQPPAGLDDPDPAVAALRLNRGIELCVREQPTQYAWSYPRFKTRPPDEVHALRVLGDSSRTLLYKPRKGVGPRRIRIP